MRSQAGWRLSQLKGKRKWLLPGSCSFFFLLSLLMTGCFLWQYHLPKLQTGSLGPEATSAPVRMCPQHPEPVPLAHPLPVLKEALEKVGETLRGALSAPGLAAMSVVVIQGDTVLWTGNFGKKNGSDPASGPPNESTMYRISSVSKIFPVLMLYRLWEEGIVASLDDPLEQYASSFTINNPLGAASAPQQGKLMDGLEEVGPAPRTSPVTLRRMAGQLSGQMYSTAADLAKLAMALLGSGPQRILGPDAAKTLLAPLLACPGAYFANETGTPWEFHAQRGYKVVRKDGDLDGYAATFSLVPPLRLGLVLLLAGPRPSGTDLVTQAYDVLLPAMERVLREAERSPAPPPSARPFTGYFTFANLTFYEVRPGPVGELRLRQFGPRVEALVPPAFRTFALLHLRGRVFQLHVAREFPCALPLGDTWLSLEAQHGQLVNFYPLDRHGLSPGFDVPGLNTYRVLRLLRKPVFKTQ